RHGRAAEDADADRRENLRRRRRGAEAARRAQAPCRSLRGGDRQHARADGGVHEEGRRALARGDPLGGRESGLMALPRIAITTGDPAGIGPEIALKAALAPEVRKICRPLLFGDRSALEAHAEACGLKPDLRCATRASDATWND